MKYDALIVIDMQTALVNAHPYNEAGVLAGIRSLLERCRASGVPVIYVCHDGGPGDELELGSPGWQVAAPIAPEPGEKRFDKHFNSAFRQTGLHEYLQQMNAKQLILCGMQTEYCFDVSCKVAFELGYEVTIARGTTTTFDNDFATARDLTRYYEEKIWANRYAQVLELNEVLSRLKGNKSS